MKPRMNLFYYIGCRFFCTFYIFITPTSRPFSFRFFFFNDTATTEIYTLSLHDALPIGGESVQAVVRYGGCTRARRSVLPADRKSTRLNSSHVEISYAVFCVKKKKRVGRHGLHLGDNARRLRAQARRVLHLHLLRAVVGAGSFVRPVARDALFPFFFFNDTATTEIYTLSLHDALPIGSAPFRTSRSEERSIPSSSSSR